MYRIAICDDDLITCTFIEESLMQYARNRHISFDVDVYTSGEDLCRSLSQSCDYDLLYLDIELKSVNGIEVASMIREVLQNEYIHIVYISAKQGYAMELFETRPMNFLLKPLSAYKIIQNLERAMQLSEKSKLEFRFQNNRVSCKIPHRDILYFMSDAKKVLLFSGTTKYEFYGKLSEVMQQLPSKDFFFIHKSYIVNYQNVKEMRSDSLTLTTGVELVISKSYKKGVREHLLKIRKESL